MGPPVSFIRLTRLLKLSTTAAYWAITFLSCFLDSSRRMRDPVLRNDVVRLTSVASIRPKAMRGCMQRGEHGHCLLFTV
jgi:hypothetical protein